MIRTQFAILPLLLLIVAIIFALFGRKGSFMNAAAKFFLVLIGLLVVVAVPMVTLVSYKSASHDAMSVDHGTSSWSSGVTPTRSASLDEPTRVASGDAMPNGPYGADEIQLEQQAVAAETAVIDADAIASAAADAAEGHAAVPPTASMVNSKPLPASLRPGEIVGMNQYWTADFERQHVADVYSSKLEAVRLLARQAARRIALSWTEESEPLPCFYEETNIHGNDHPSLANAFRSEVRKSLPRAFFVSNRDEASVTLNLHRLTQHGHSYGKLQVQLALGNIIENIETRFASENWVKNDTDYRLSRGKAEYFVALGFADGTSEPQSAIDAAADRLQPRIRREISDLPVPMFPSDIVGFSREVTELLVQDRFMQHFSSTADGTPLEYPVMREAVLIDYFDEKLASATRRVAGQDDRRRNGDTSVNPPSLFGLTALSLACFGVLLVISRLFDGKMPKQ